jgi:hypothetical protein
MSEGGPPGAQPESDIFTVLVIIATVFVAVATIYTSVRASGLYGNWLPF